MNSKWALSLVTYIDKYVSQDLIVNIVHPVIDRRTDMAVWLSATESDDNICC